MLHWDWRTRICVRMRAFASVNATHRLCQSAGDPVALALVASINPPGVNITGHVGGGVATAPMGKKPLTPEQRERRRAYLKAWRSAHREHCIAYDKRQRQKRREQRRADNARWYDTHREQVLARRKRYYEENRERINQERKKRRRAQREANRREE